MCEIAYIDHFGNCITNIPVSHAVQHISVAGHIIKVGQSYGDGVTGHAICVPGSVGYYEIACYQGSAQALMMALKSVSEWTKSVHLSIPIPGSPI